MALRAFCHATLKCYKELYDGFDRYAQEAQEALLLKHVSCVPDKWVLLERTEPLQVQGAAGWTREDPAEPLEAVRGRGSA